MKFFFSFHTNPIRDICMNDTDIKANLVTFSNTTNQLENTGQTYTITNTPQLPMSVRYHSNNNNNCVTPNIYSSYNNANELFKINGPMSNSAPILRKVPPIPPRTITMFSMPGSPKVGNNTKQNEDRKSTATELLFNTPKPALRQRTRVSSPPPLMNQINLNVDSRPRLMDSDNRPTLARLHRAPSPHFPLHIMSTQQRGFNTQENMRSFSSKSQNRSSHSLLNWVRRKSTDSASCRLNNQRVRTPSAIFYDSEEPPVEC